ncbi:MAG: UvrD-helicase domain-containing protein [Gemmatimonadales bacterium]
MAVKRGVPPDQAARERIARELDTNLLVEAGAGSGKTTSLVGRMLALVEGGTPVDRLAAVTFTRKAAAELRERFQEALEQKLTASRQPGRDEAFQVYDRALRELDGAFLGTIHAFCARLLREHPFEAGLDPAFLELTQPEFDQLQRVFWERWLERAVRDDDPRYDALKAVGVDARELFAAFHELCEFPDIEFPAVEAPVPDAGPCRRRFLELLDEGLQLLPPEEHEDGWDDLQRQLRRLAFLRQVYRLDDLAQFMTVLDEVRGKTPTQKRWSDTQAGKAAAKRFGQDWGAFVDQLVMPLRRQWREHRYVPVLGFLRPAVREFQRERVATGRLSFTDLLLQTARMLLESPRARRELGQRYRHLLVDEFQDTDPVQAEVCLLLGSEPEAGTDWRTVVPRPGALFVVGDPKQSIYRFRRADIETYEFVKRRFAEFGDTLALTANFRSVPGIAALVNRHFEGPFPAAAGNRQAGFSPLEAVRADPPSGGAVRWYGRGGSNIGGILAEDASAVASWIARRVESGERRPGDFMILTYRRPHVDAYVSALAERNVAAIAGGGELEEERELRELKLVLEALADPDNPVAVLAAVEGLLFGVGPAQLIEGMAAGERLSITRAPKDPATALGAALARLDQWFQYAAANPADLLLERILDDSGLLALAASADQGNSRAGMLLYLVDAIRATDVPAGITEAIRRIAETLERSEATPALEPGRADMVRVMNVHKAKGLEAPVVILAAPHKRWPRAPDLHVHRAETGEALGVIRIAAPGTGDNPRQRERPVITQPAGWDAWEAEETAMLDAEWDRLLYVAATRARDELVVGLGEEEVAAITGQGLRSSDKETTWGRLADALAATGVPVDLPTDAPPGRHRLDETAETVRARVVAAEQARVAAAAAGVEFVTVSEDARAESRFEREFDLRLEDAAAPPSADDIGGRVWGRLVHRTIEAMGRGRSGPALEMFIRAVVRDECRDADEATQARVRIDLARLAAEIREGAPWTELAAAKAAYFELPVATWTAREDGTGLCTEGVIDAAAFDGTSWTVVDWKTDRSDLYASREATYRVQVERYGAMITAVTGAAVTARLAPVRRSDGETAPEPASGEEQGGQFRLL